MIRTGRSQTSRVRRHSSASVLRIQDVAHGTSPASAHSSNRPRDSAADSHTVAHLPGDSAHGETCPHRKYQPQADRPPAACCAASAPCSTTRLLLLAVLMIATAAFLPLTGGEALDPDAHPALEFVYRAVLVLLIVGYFGIFWTRRGQTLGMASWRLQHRARRRRDARLARHRAASRGRRAVVAAVRARLPVDCDRPAAARVARPPERHARSCSCRRAPAAAEAAQRVRSSRPNVSAASSTVGPQPTIHGAQVEQPPAALQRAAQQHEAGADQDADHGPRALPGTAHRSERERQREDHDQQQRHEAREARPQRDLEGVRSRGCCARGSAM